MITIIISSLLYRDNHYYFIIREIVAITMCGLRSQCDRAYITMMHREKERTNERRRGTPVSLNETRDLRKPKSTDMRFLAYVNICTKAKGGQKPRKYEHKELHIHIHVHTRVLYIYLLTTLNYIY